ncbi:MAG TPA: beta-ketoacyl-ACP synthase 3 [Chitinispirillaceae bacterium]|nr:beta-ketoacyl-ACP synthase 3 [Chitinispirillaceae bacterium]
MSNDTFKISLFLPAQAAAETEAMITKWLVKAGDIFSSDQVLAEVESAKSTFEFNAPCNGKVVQLLFQESVSFPIEKAIVEIETNDQSMKTQIPAAGAVPVIEVPAMTQPPSSVVTGTPAVKDVFLLGIGTYIPETIVPNSRLLVDHTDISEEYIFGVTGIRERRWASPEESPSDMALKASRQAIEKSGLKPEEIDGIIVSTTTPDYMMPSTACILQDKLGIRGALAFDLNAACSGWLYALSVAKGLILSGMGSNILVVAAEMQSRLLDKKDRNTYFLFGDGAGATVVSGVKKGHLIRSEIMLADPAGIKMASRRSFGNEIPEKSLNCDPWLRIDGKALFRFATERFSSIINELIVKSGWSADDVRWIVPHQANGRILKAAAAKTRVSFDRFFINIDRVGNTSSASIPVALSEIERGIQKKDKLIFCTVGAGVTAAGMSIEW